MRSLAIIPARGGSKRIPRKNIKLFLGKPILAYSIEVALESECFDEVMVSTDDNEIADLAIAKGANVPFLRSAFNANDFATTASVILEVLEQYKAKGKEFDHVCCIYPTAPFITKRLLQKGYRKLVENNFDCVFPILQYSFPIQRSLYLRDGKIKLTSPEYSTTRSQDLEKTYHDSGQYYWLNVHAFLKNKKLWTENTGAILLSEMDAHDIDNLEDWKVAEFKYILKNETQNII